MQIVYPLHYSSKCPVVPVPLLHNTVNNKILLYISRKKFGYL